MPLKTNERQALEALSSILRERYRVVDILLFGSKARGTDTDESDVDLMAVLPGRGSPDVETEIDDLVFDINLRHDCLIVPIYYTEEELMVGPMSESPLYKKVLMEGLRL